MSDLDRWLGTAKSSWEKWRAQLVRLTPGPKMSSEQLQSEDATTRWRAVRALAGRPAPDLLSDLIPLAGDEDEMVRAATVDTLISWDATVVLGPVRMALSTHPDPAAAASLLTILARLPAAANRAAILPWLQADEPEVRAAAFMALAALCDDDDLPQLEEALKNDDLSVQRAILTTLCAPAAGPLAVKAASASDPILRQRAGQAQLHIQRNLEARQKAEAQAQKKQQSRAGKDASE